MVGRCISFWDGLFSEAICDFQDVHWHKKCMYIPMYRIYIRHPHAQNSLIRHRTSFSNDCLFDQLLFISWLPGKMHFHRFGRCRWKHLCQVHWESGIGVVTLERSGMRMRMMMMMMMMMMDHGSGMMADDDDGDDHYDTTVESRKACFCGHCGSYICWIITCAILLCLMVSLTSCEAEHPTKVFSLLLLGSYLWNTLVFQYVSYHF